MKRSLFTITLMFFAAFVMAQGTQNGQCPNAGNGQTIIDPETLTTYQGVVWELDIAWGQNSPAISVQTSEGTLLALLGPIWYMDQNSFILEKDDHIEIALFRAEKEGETIFITQMIQNIDRDLTLIFRDETGIPQWRSKKNQKKVGGNRTFTSR